MSKRIWHKGSLGKPSGIYQTKRNGLCDHYPKAKNKIKEIGKRFIKLDESMYKSILNDLYKVGIVSDRREINKKFGINGSANFYFDLKSNNIEQYKDWWFKK
jgi:ribosomal protein S25